MSNVNTEVNTIKDGYVPSELIQPGESVGPTDYLIYGNYFYDVALLDMDSTEVDNRYVYLWGEYFYPYRGEWNDPSIDTQPGIYWDTKSKKIIRVDPSTDDEKEEFKVYGKLYRADFNTIKDLVNTGKCIIQNIPESSKSFISPLKSSDDILKRLMKLAIQEKGVDLDRYRARFVDKNALFNFKQVLKGDNRLSMLLFDRGVSALNLKYSIILEEKDPERPLGAALSHRLIATSEDTYDM